MDRNPFDRDVAEDLFENNKPDIFGLEGKELPLVISDTVFIDAAGHIILRLQTESDGGLDPAYDAAITPYAAIRLATALADLAHASGQYRVSMDVEDATNGVRIRLPRS